MTLNNPIDVSEQTVSVALDQTALLCLTVSQPAQFTAANYAILIIGFRAYLSRISSQADKRKLLIFFFITERICVQQSAYTQQKQSKKLIFLPCLDKYNGYLK